MRVIIVDDERSALQNARLKCEKISAITEIYTFGDPESAIAFAEHQAIDLAFLDIQMAEMDGLALCAVLKKINPAIAVIFMTAYEGFALDAFRCDASGYLLKPFSDDALRHEVEKIQISGQSESCRLIIRTFGNFDVFVSKNALEFPSAKSKELLALLINQRGGILSPEQASTYLWEDRTYDDKTKVLFRAVFKSLVDTLKTIDAQDIIRNKTNNKSIDVTRVNCDLYEYIAGNLKESSGYCGQYMEQYSWGETTKALLDFGKLRPT